jgi:hypothetical protein
VASDCWCRLLFSPSLLLFRSLWSTYLKASAALWDRTSSVPSASGSDYLLLCPPDRLPRVLSPRADAAEKRWCPCGDVWQAQWCCGSVTGALIRLRASLHCGEFA